MGAGAVEPSCGSSTTIIPCARDDAAPRPSTASPASADAPGIPAVLWSYGVAGRSVLSADEQGRHFDFSAVPFRRVSRDEDGLPGGSRGCRRRTHRKLALIVALAAHFDLAMPQARSPVGEPTKNAVS
ncbi:opine metallophore biosynthesis dehydrogenase [Pseudomonas aeruginosa]